MVMSRDHGFKLSFALFCIKLLKGYQIWGKLAQEQEHYRQKTN